MRRILILSALAFVVAVPTASAKTLYVDDDRAQCRGAPFTAIQPAVDAAASGDTIRVCNGTYAEQVVLPQAKSSLSLRAVSRLGATLRPPVGGLPFGAGDPAAIVVTRGPNTVVRDLVIAGPLRYTDQDAGCQEHTHPSGVAVPEGSATIDSNRFEDISVTCPGYVAGSGVHIGDVDFSFALPPVLPRVTVDRNVIEAHNGVVAEGAATVVVQRNGITGPGAEGSGFLLLESFDNSPNFSATVRGNDITGFDVGIRGLIGGRPLVVSNTVHGNATGAQFGESARGEMRDNVFRGNGVGIELGALGRPVARWLVRRNRVRDSTSDGIRMGPEASKAASERNTLLDNSSLGNGGLDCLDESTGSGTDGTSNIWSRNVGVTDNPNVCRAP